MVGTKVVLFGDPIVDIVAHVPASVLDDIDAEPGGCSLVSSEELEGLLSIPSVQATARRWVRVYRRPGRHATGEHV